MKQIKYLQLRVLTCIVCLLYSRKPVISPVVFVFLLDASVCVLGMAPLPTLGLLLFTPPEIIIKVQVLFFILILIKNISSSTSHKKAPSLRLSVRLYGNLTVQELRPVSSKPNPSPNAFPKLCARFSARIPLKGRATVPSFAL